MLPRAFPVTQIRLCSVSAFVVVCTLLGCGGSVEGDSVANGVGGADASAGADAAVAGDVDAGIAACGHYFAAQYSRCGGPTLPSSETNRARSRFEQICLNEMALPGSGMTAASVEACASALDVSPCEFPVGQPAECSFHGSLAGGAPCNEGLQCQSASCQGTVSNSPGGQIGPVTCGTCEPATTVGQVCAHGNFSAGCPAGAACIITQSTASDPSPTYTCVAIAGGDLGAACDTLAAGCKTGLYCAAQTGQCAHLADAGASCGIGPGWPGGCVAPEACAGGVCVSGSVGTQCTGDLDCAAGLGCAAGSCVSITWVGADKPCGGAVRCLVGSCNSPPSGPDGGLGGTCPTVVPDGQPCTVHGVGPVPSGPTCDTFAECFSPTGGPGATGTCTLLGGAACN
jgi:hypothetical protein